ncbi:c-type cytochrome [Diaphorobacter aerolatus]|uniref:c-type cytochrome n=1 Tax=Diaphorobacter aerolatus TaxID=1288495 RepID=UPI001D01BC9F|nr:c-type cytochrome [Diaphorobacter aerolatus]
MGDHRRSGVGPDCSRRCEGRCRDCAKRCSPAVAACATCHGANGEGSAAFPPLAGTAFAYLREQLGAFANGSRNQPAMAPIAKALSDKDKADVSAYYAGLPSGIPAASSAPQTPKPDDAGAWLVLRGRLSDGIPACASCHATNGAGVGNTFPAIAKLGAVYMQQQIDAWKNNSRGPGPLGLMQTIARKLSNNDVQAVADYYARQQPGKN